MFTLCISLPSVYTFFNIKFWTRRLAGFPNVVYCMFVSTCYVPGIFLSCDTSFSLVGYVPTFSRYIFHGGKWYFYLSLYAFLTVCSGSSRSISVCLWLPLIFKLNNIALHNVSLTVVKSYSKILICGVILDPCATPTGVSGKNSVHLNKRWIWEGIS